MHNEFNLVRLIGLMTLSIGVFFLLGTTAIFIKDINHAHFDLETKYVFAFGVLYFLIGICTLVKLSWTRIAAPILYLFSILAILFYFLVIESLPRTETTLFLLLLSLPCILLFCAILFITNKKVIAEYDRGETAAMDESDILDIDL